VSSADDQRWSAHHRYHESVDRAHRETHAAEERALDVRSREVDRRLEDLNHLRDEVVSDRAQFLRSETFMAEHRLLQQEVRGLMDTLTKRVDDAEKAIDRATGAVNTWRWIAGFLGASGVALLLWNLINLGHP
jgi:hypothetical protein